MHRNVLFSVIFAAAVGDVTLVGVKDKTTAEWMSLPRRAHGASGRGGIVYKLTGCVSLSICETTLILPH